MTPTPTGRDNTTGRWKSIFLTPTRIVYGAGCGFMNMARINGVRKFSHDRQLRALHNHGRRVIIVDESYTTKRCSYCSEVNGVSSDVIVSKSPVRYVYCPIWRRGTHRDKNGAKNILVKTLLKSKENISARLLSWVWQWFNDTVRSRIVALWLPVRPSKG